MNKREMRKVHPLLKVIIKLSDEDKQVLMRYLTHEGCDGVYECIHNGLTNHTLIDGDKRMLQSSLIKHKNKFRKLIKEQDPDKKKRALLQVGEGIGLILDKVVPLLEEFVNKEKK